MSNRSHGIVLESMKPVRQTPGRPVRPGDVIAGSYRIEHIIAHGGMGIVAAARNCRSRAAVVVKLIKPTVTDVERAIHRFRRESWVLARLRTEHTVRLVDVGTMTDGWPFMVLEMLRGTNLQHLMRRRGSLRVAEAINYVLQTCVGLADAHRQDIVHRDLKPANLFLTYQPGGQELIKVLDFGICRLATPPKPLDGDLTAEYSIVGSPLYFAPEQLRDSRLVSGRSDIWSLGVLLHHLVSGRLPFTANTLADCISQVVLHPPTPLREHRGDAPVELEQIVLRCLQKKPANRFADVVQFAAQLARLAPQHAGAYVNRIRFLYEGRRQASPPNTDVSGQPSNLPSASESSCPPPRHSHVRVTEHRWVARDRVYEDLKSA